MHMLKSHEHEHEHEHEGHGERQGNGQGEGQATRQRSANLLFRTWRLVERREIEEEADDVRKLLEREPKHG